MLVVLATDIIDVDFSALQRAENSSMCCGSTANTTLRKFQCSSASRKFLNSFERKPLLKPTRDFSALQRAENSSITRRRSARGRRAHFSALQRAENSSISLSCSVVWLTRGFQCSSASRKFLNRIRQRQRQRVVQFQCSSASRKFLNRTLGGRPSMPSKAFQCSSASRKFLNIVE